MNVPNYLTLLDFINQLFNNQKTESVDLSAEQQTLVNWAQRVNLLKIQLTGKVVSVELKQMLMKELDELLTIFAKLNQKKPNDEKLTEFKTLVDQFYQDLNELTHTLTNEVLKSQWKKSTAMWRGKDNNDQPKWLCDKDELDKNGETSSDPADSANDEKEGQKRASIGTYEEGEEYILLQELFDDDDW